MSNPYLTGSFNKCKNKIKGNAKMNLSITPNTKITQYIERQKNVNHNRSPSNLLNKSQNIKDNQQISKINLRNYIIKKKLNKSNKNNNTGMKHHQRKSNSINPSRNNFSLKLNSMNNLPGFYCKKKSNKNSINNAKTISKNNSLSFYYFSKNNTCNNKVQNLAKTNKDFGLKKLNCIKANLSYYSNFNYKKGIKLLKNNPLVNLTTTENSNSRNFLSSVYNHLISEESKVGARDKSKNKMNYLNLKKSKKQQYNFLFTKIKSNNVPLKIPYKNTYHPSFTKNISSDKNYNSPSLDSKELRILKNIKNLKEIQKSDKFNEIKKIYEESLVYFLPKEYKNIFFEIWNEIDNIKKDDENEIKNLKKENNDLMIKIQNLENENKSLIKNLEQKENELNLIKKKLDEKKKNYDRISGEVDKRNNKLIQDEDGKENKTLNLKRDNSYFARLNKKNLNDLDAIYFFDKINNNNAEHKMAIKNNKSLDKNYNYTNNNGEIIPFLNLDPEYIEECKNKELMRIEEENLTPFQRIALKFQMS